MGTYIIGGLITICFVMAIAKIVKDMKRGVCSGCSGCSGNCSHGQKNKS